MKTAARFRFRNRLHGASMFVIRPFLVALQFLTALPVRSDTPPSADFAGRSLVYYPVVGLLIGALLAVLGEVLDASTALPGAALLLAMWVLLTGALHLDGLADSADAWVGGFGDRDRTLAIMKDPCCGPVAVVVLVVVLLLKFTALVQLLYADPREALVLAPVAGRAAVVYLFLTTPYVRVHGLGSVLTKHLPRRACAVAVAATLAMALLVIGTAAIWPLLAAAAMFLILRRLMLRRLQGTSGDTAGALIELTETVVLLTAALAG